jgi:hypothetical protein
MIASMGPIARGSQDTIEPRTKITLDENQLG